MHMLNEKLFSQKIFDNHQSIQMVNILIRGYKVV